MRLKSLLPSLAFFFVAATTAKAQIGWTPAQMEAKYGKSVNVKVVSKRLYYALYGIDPGTLPTLAAFGVAGIKAKYFDGKAVELSIYVKNLTREQFKAISLSMLDENPHAELAHNFPDIQRNGYTIMSYDYKRYGVMYLSNQEVLIEPGSLTDLNIAVTNEEARISADSQQQQTEALQKELRGKK